MSIISQCKFLKTRISDIFWGSDLIASRFFISLASLCWSFLLFWPGETFGRPTYTLMGKLAPEWAWALMFGIQGALGMYSILYKSRNKFLLIGDGILGCILWTGSCVAMLLSVYPPPAAISAEIIAAFMSWWILVRYPIDLEK
jgi:hypothetical protein